MPAIEVRTPYAAALLWAIDNVTDVYTGSPSFKRWVVDRDADWIRWWREHQIGWHDELTTCSFQVETLDQLVACAERSVTREDAPSVARYLRSFDQVFGGKIRRLFPMLSRKAEEVRAAASSARTSDVLRGLQLLVAGPSYREPRWIISVVPKLDDGHLNARTYRDGMVLEVSEDLPVELAVTSLFHEMVHWAIAETHARNSVDAYFQGSDLRVLVAKSMWEEAVATAFDRMAGEWLFPRFRFGDEYYDHAGIDALARALHAEWSRPDGRFPVRSTEFAGQMTRLIDNAYPPSRWRVRDLFMRASVWTVNRSVISTFARRFDTRRLQFFWEIPDRVAQTNRPRIVVATRDELAGHDALLRQFGTSMSDVEGVLRRHRAAYLPGYVDEVPQWLVVGRTDRDLIRAIEKAADSPAHLEHTWRRLR